MMVSSATPSAAHGTSRSRDRSTTEYDCRAAVPDHERFFERWTRDSAIARERASRRLDVRLRRAAAETLDVFPTTRERRAGAGLHPRRLVARVRQARPLVHRARRSRAKARWWCCRTTRCAGGDDRARSRCRCRARWPGRGATRRCTAATRGASSSPATRPAGIWRRCCCAALAAASHADLPARPGQRRAVDLGPLRSRAAAADAVPAAPTCASTPTSVRRLSPAGFPAPAGAALCRRRRRARATSSSARPR